MINLKKYNYLTIIILSILTLSSCYKDDGGIIHKYDTNINTKTENFELEANSFNVGKWINTNISVKKDVSMPLNIKGGIHLCGKNIVNKKIDALSCSDFSSPNYPVYSEMQIADDFELDPATACPATKAFSNTMQYMNTGISVLTGDQIRFSLQPKNISFNACANPPSSITLENSVNSAGNNINSAKFCNDYLSTLPAGANVFQAYINNDFGPEGNKVMLRDDSPITWLGESEKEISYIFPHVYINYFDNTDAFLNFVVDPNYSLSPLLNYQLNSNHNFQYYQDIYKASTIGSNQYAMEYDNLVYSVKQINKLLKNVEYFSEILPVNDLDIYRLFNRDGPDTGGDFTDDGYLFGLIRFAHDYRRILVDIAHTHGSSVRYNATEVNFYSKFYNNAYNFYMLLWPTGSYNAKGQTVFGRLLHNGNTVIGNDGGGIDNGIDNAKNVRKKLFTYLKSNKTKDGLKFSQKYTQFALEITSLEKSAIPQKLDDIGDYKHQGRIMHFSNAFAVDKNTCNHNYNIDDVDLFLQHLERKIEAKLNFLKINSMDFKNLYSWHVFEEKLKVLKTLRRHEFFCYDAIDGQSFDHATIMNEIKIAYIEFVNSLKRRDHYISSSTINNKNINLYPFWLRSNLIDFRDFTQTSRGYNIKPGQVGCNLIQSVTDPRKKFDIYSLNANCRNICARSTQKNCVHTMITSVNVNNESGSIKLFNKNYNYDKGGTYNVIADRLVAKISTDGKVDYNSVGKCVANEKSAKCTDFASSFSDSIRLNKEYLVTEDGQLMLIIVDDEMGYGNNYGGYNVNIEHSCDFNNGSGLYYYTGSANDVNGKTHQDLNAKSLNNVLDEDGMGYITPEHDGKLWLYIPSRSGATAAYSGKYNIQTTSEIGNTPISDILMPILNIFERKLYGERNANGEYDHTKPGIVKKFYKGFITQSGFSKMLQALLVLYIAFTAFGYLTGILDVKNADILLRLIKFSIITILMSGSSWDFFNETVFALVKDGSQMLVEAVTTNSGYLSGNPFALYDRISNIIFSAQTWERIGLMFGIFPAGFIAFWFLLGVVGDILVFLFKGLIIYFSSVFVASILLGLSPIFIPFFLFSLTRKVFDGWVKQLMSYILIPVFYFSAISITVTILITLLRQIFGFDYVIKCAKEWKSAKVIQEIWGTTIGTAASFVIAFIPDHCIYYWPEVSISDYGKYYGIYGGLPYQLTQVVALYALTKVIGKIVKLSKDLSASIIGFLPNASAGSVADLGDKVTSGMEKAVGADKESQERRKKAASHTHARKKNIGDFMEARSSKHGLMDNMFEQSKDKDKNEFATELNNKADFDDDDKQELWQQYKDYNGIRDDQSFEDYTRENDV